MRHIDRSISQNLKPILVRHPFLHIELGAKHARVRNTRSGDFLPIAGSLSDARGTRNFEADLRRLIESGHGLIFSKTGRMPSAT